MSFDELQEVIKVRLDELSREGGRELKPMFEMATEGYTIDKHASGRPVAYKGPRHHPDEWHPCFTELETFLIEVLSSSHGLTRTGAYLATGLETVKALYPDDPSAPGINVSLLPNDMHYVSALRYTERFGKGKEVVAKATHPNLPDALAEVANLLNSRTTSDAADDPSS